MKYQNLSLEALEEEAKQRGYDILYYREKGLLATVCLLLKRKEFKARGVAICSPKDLYRYSKKEGKRWAISSALLADDEKNSSRKIFRYKNDEFKTMYDVACSVFGYHSSWNPYSTHKERTILNKV